MAGILPYAFLLAVSQWFADSTFICREDWPYGFSQEQVAFFGYHHAVGQCKGDPFVIASTGLEQIEAWTSKDHEGIALRLRYSIGGEVARFAGEPNFSSPESHCDFVGQKLDKVIVFTTKVQKNQTYHNTEGSPITPESPYIQGIEFVQDDQRCLIGKDQGLGYHFSPNYRFHLPGLWGRASTSITQIGVLMQPLQHREVWAGRTVFLPDYAQSVAYNEDGSLRCAGGTSGRFFVDVSHKGIQELGVYAGAEGLITALRFRFVGSEEYIRIGQAVDLSNVDEQCTLHFSPKEVLVSLRLFQHPTWDFFGRLELQTSNGQSCEAGEGDPNRSIALEGSQNNTALLGFWGTQGDAIDCLGALVGNTTSMLTDPDPGTIALDAYNALIAVFAGAVLVSAGLVLWFRHRHDRASRLQKLGRLQRSVSKLEDIHQELDRTNYQCLAWLLSFWAAARKRRAHRLLQEAAASAAGGPVFWGLTVMQLSEFYQQHDAYLIDYCCDHVLSHAGFEHVCLRNPCPHRHGSCIFRQPALAEDVRSLPRLVPNMHVVVPLLVKPATEVHDGIYGLATLANLESPKSVETFVSHCWSEPFQDFVATLETIRLNTVVWVCSFAIPQNMDISEQLKSEPMSSPFAIALLKAECVLLAVDETFEPLTRSWCCYELYLAISKGTRVEIRGGTNNKGFYGKLAAASQTVDIRHCRATDSRDHAKIMAALKGSEDLVNRKIRERVEDTAQFVKALT